MLACCAHVFGKLTPPHLTSPVNHFGIEADRFALLTLRLLMYILVFSLNHSACLLVYFVTLLTPETLGSFLHGDRASPGASSYLPKAPVTLLTMTAASLSQFPADWALPLPVTPVGI